MNKQYLYLLPVVFFLSAGPVAAHGDDDGSTRNNVITQEDKDRENRIREIKQKTEEYRKALTEKQAEILKSLCEKKVAHRQRELERLQTKVAGSDKYTAEEKNQLVSDIATKLNELAAINTNCTNRTDLAQLKEQVRAMERKRIFASVLPRLNATHAVNKATAFTGRLLNHTAVLQEKIDRAKQAGCDITDEEAALTEYTNAVKKAQGHLAKAKEIIATFKDTADPGAAKREQLKAEMTAMKNALLEARDAHKEIRAGLKLCPKPAEETEDETSS